MLEARNIHKVYNNGKKELPVLKGVDLAVGKGSFAAIVGPSGAGKSTLLHILGGLDSPSQGEVIFEEENIYKLKDNSLSRVRNKKIGFVFQFYHLLSEFTVLENVLMPALISPQSTVSSSPQIKEKAAELLNQMGLSERAGHFPAQLSGGEKQRVAIARGLINRPRLLLCDEPTGNLDSKTGDEIVSLIKQLNKSEEMSVVLVTHNQALAEAADKIYHLKDGILIN
ncbi:MAG: ABC transporter ATP-binding protein [Candidatus Omnitrophota bacterium]|nr:ABC transporter ATP-binding protein [Candidatus Omnitrophota bacterium]